MFGKVWAWIRNLSDIVTLIQFVGSVGLAGFSAILIQESLNLALELSLALRLLLGIFIFFMVLAVALAILKAVLQRHPGEKGEKQDSASQSSDFQLWQELKCVESENTQLRAALQESEQENEQLRDWIDKIEPFKQRLQLKWTLEAIGRMGNNLPQRQPPDVAVGILDLWLDKKILRRQNRRLFSHTR